MSGKCVCVMQMISAVAFDRQLSPVNFFAVFETEEEEEEKEAFYCSFLLYFE